MTKLHELISAVFYIVASLIFALLSVTMIATSIWEIVISFGKTEDFIFVILDSVGLLVVAVAVFDVAKFLIEEQVLRTKEVRTPEESKKTLTKFMTIIVIAVSLEALVLILAAGKTDVTTLVYPTLLLLAAVAIVVGLGFYQKLSTAAQSTGDQQPGRRPDSSRRDRPRDQNR
ncbi:MAG: hypothetical protein ACREV0_04630 [Burkholderiales bacterium]